MTQTLSGIAFSPEINVRLISKPMKPPCDFANSWNWHSHSSFSVFAQTIVLHSIREKQVWIDLAPLLVFTKTHETCYSLLLEGWWEKMMTNSPRSSLHLEESYSPLFVSYRAVLLFSSRNTWHHSSQTTQRFICTKNAYPGTFQTHVARPHKKKSITIIYWVMEKCFGKKIILVA